MVEQVGPELPGEKRHIGGIAVDEERGNDLPDLSVAEFASPLGLQGGHDGLAQTPAGQLFHRVAGQLGQKIPAIGDELLGPRRDFLRNLDEVAQPAGTRPFSRSGMHDDGDDEGKFSLRSVFGPLFPPEGNRVFQTPQGHVVRRAGLVFEQDVEADRATGGHDAVNDIFAVLFEGVVETGNFLDGERAPVHERQECRREPGFQKFACHAGKRHAVAEDPVVGLCGLWFSGLHGRKKRMKAES